MMGAAERIDVVDNPRACLRRGRHEPREGRAAPPVPSTGTADGCRGNRPDIELQIPDSEAGLIAALFQPTEHRTLATIVVSDDAAFVTCAVSDTGEIVLNDIRVAESVALPGWRHRHRHVRSRRRVSGQHMDDVWAC